LGTTYLPKYVFSLYDKVKIEKYIEEGKIEIVPVSFMRGRTFPRYLV
jgi:phosphate starvation-inducible protein PhoH